MPDFISKDTFRSGMQMLAASVHIITSADDTGKSGLTATAVCSLSDAPPSLLVSVNRSSRTHDFILRSGKLAVNILSDTQSTLSNHFGASGVDDSQFRTEDGWSTAQNGMPILQSSAAWFSCSVYQSMTTSTHSVFDAHITEANMQSERTPLIYMNESYWELK